MQLAVTLQCTEQCGPRFSSPGPESLFAGMRLIIQRRMRKPPLCYNQFVVYQIMGPEYVHNQTCINLAIVCLSLQIHPPHVTIG